MKDRFKHFTEMIITRDVNKEKFNELIKNFLHDEYMYVRETALVVGDEIIEGDKERTQWTERSNFGLKLLTLKDASFFN